VAWQLALEAKANRDFDITNRHVSLQTLAPALSFSRSGESSHFKTTFFEQVRTKSKHNLLHIVLIMG